MTVFGRKSYLPASLIDPILKNKAYCLILIKELNYRPDRVSDGIIVKNLLKLWVCKLFFVKRHPSFQKNKILKYGTLIAIKEILLPMNQPHLFDWSDAGRRLYHTQVYLRNRTTAQTEYLMVSTVKNLVKFWVYKLSFTKRRMIGYFRKKNMSNIPGGNGSSLNKLITIKIIALTNITLKDTSVLAVFP
jgi:hypothetical protein